MQEDYQRKGKPLLVEDMNTPPKAGRIPAQHEG
jgi:hypothetical protein